MKVLGIDNVLLAVGDFEEAKRFYGETLGLPVKFEFPPMGMAGFQLGNEEPGLVLRAQSIAPATPRESPRVWLEVPDARAAAAELDRAGVEPLGPAREIHTGWVVEVADPWGNVIGLTDYVKAPQMARKAHP